MRPIRFCMLTTFYPPWSFGGDGIQVQRLARALAAAGHQVTVVHSPEAYRALARSRPEGGVEDPAVRVVPIDAGIGTASPLLTYLSGRPLATRRRLEEVLEQDFDVLHFHNPSLLGGPAVLRMGEAMKLCTAHEQWLICPTHVLWKYKRRVCERPQCWRCGLSYGRPPQLWRQTRLLERSVAGLDALIAPSRTTARLHERFAPSVRIERIAHFVPEGEGTEPPRGDGEPYFLYVGRLESIKGVATLLEAFRRRRSERLLIVGAGSLEASLRRAATDLPNVDFAGWVEQGPLAGLYRDALAVIVPTLGHESFGLVAVEAFARGTPAIVRRFGALAELIEESGGGIAYGTEEELDAAISRLASDGELRRELGERGRAAYLERWTPEVHLRNYLGLIAELAGARGEPGLAASADPRVGDRR